LRAPRSDGDHNSRTLAASGEVALESLLARVRAEYLEMPGLSLTLEQAQRLWAMERGTCEALLQALTDSQFLRRTAAASFVLRGDRA
jgi:hypothetical protein